MLLGTGHHLLGADLGVWWAPSSASSTAHSQHLSVLCGVCFCVYGTSVWCVCRMSVCGPVCEAALSSVGLGCRRLIRCKWLPAWREILMYRDAFPYRKAPHLASHFLGSFKERSISSNAGERDRLLWLLGKSSGASPEG